MREELKKRVSLFYDYYLEVMYVVLLILSAGLISYFNVQNRITCFIILGMHFLSLYMIYLIWEKLTDCKNKMISDIARKMHIGRVMLIINIILFILAAILHVFVPIIIAIILSINISFIFYYLTELFIVEDDCIVSLNLSNSKIEKKFFELLWSRSINKIIKIMFLVIPFILLKVALNLLNLTTLLNIIIFIAYIAIIYILIQVGEKYVCLESLIDKIFDR